MATRRQPPQPYPELIASDEIIPVTTRSINSLWAVREKIVTSVRPEAATYENVVTPLANADHAIQDTFGMIDMLRYAAPEERTRQAAEEAYRLWVAAWSEFSNCHDIYRLLQAVKDRKEDLEAEPTKYLDDLLVDFLRCGYGRLSSTGLADYLQRRDAIDNLRAEFARNIRDAPGGIWLAEADLNGVLQQDISRFHAAAAIAQQEQTTPSNKECFVELTYSNYSAVMRYAQHSDTRKRVYVAYYSKNPENVSIFKTVILLRDQNARQLGYSSHASYRLERRLAKTTQWVYDFMDRLEDTLLPKAVQEVNSLLVVAGRASQHNDGNTDGSAATTPTIPAWDYPSLRRLTLAAVSVDHVGLSEYFTVNAVVLRMLDLLSYCLQMRFAKIRSPQVWDPHVEAWEVWDERPGKEQEFIGYLYMDLMFRENKHKGCQNVNLQPSYINEAGKRIYPSTLIMCNFPPSTPLGSVSCILLRHENVVSLFHELGHGIHDLVSRTRYARLHGWRSPPDYCEVLSTMLENWCWLEWELKNLSCHYTALDPTLLQEWRKHNPGKEDPVAEVPDTLIKPLIQNRHMFRAWDLRRQLVVARFDMAVHDTLTPEACHALDPTKLYADLETRLEFLAVSDPSDLGFPYASTPHLLSGYDAGYYGYLSAQAFAADMFSSKFANDPRNQETWECFRTTILERGASRDEMLNLQEFLGRMPDTSAIVI